jgi:hypothetical protein
VSGCESHPIRHRGVAAFDWAVSIEAASVSIPSTDASGYARASAMLDQPTPQPMSAIRAFGRRKTSFKDGTPARAPGRICSYQGRFMSPCDSRASVPYCLQGTPPPVRYALSGAGNCAAAAANMRASGAR